MAPKKSAQEVGQDANRYTEEIVVFCEQLIETAPVRLHTDCVQAAERVKSVYYRVLLGVV